jgi:ankyrin repeat protein
LFFSVGETPLHYAIRSGSLKLVRMLMENGADPTAVGEDNATPFDIAEQYQNIEVLDCLQGLFC